MNVVEIRKRRSGIEVHWKRLVLRYRWLILFLATFPTTQPRVLQLWATAIPQSGKTEPTPGSGNAEAQLQAIESYIVENRFEESLPRLNAYVKDHPDSARAHYDLGYVLFRTHEFGPSIKELSKSLELNVNDPEAHKILGLDCSSVGRYDLSEAELLQAERLKPESAEIHYFVGRIYYTRGVYPLAQREYETAIRLDPSYMKAYSNLGLTLEALGHGDAAFANYTKAAQLDEQQRLHSEWPYVYLSAFYNRQENANQALSYAQKALAINPNSDVAYFQMAKAYRSQSEWQKAADAAQSAIAINSQTPDFYYVLSLMLRKLGREKESETAMAKVAELQKQSIERVRDLLNRPPQEPLTPREPR